MSFKRKARKKKQKVNDRVDKMLYKEEMILKHMELVKELYLDEDLAKQPKKLNQILNSRWSDYLKNRLDELKKESYEQFLLFRSQISPAITKINNNAG
jgi:hypothetical protein